MARTPTLVSTQQAADMLELTPGSFRSFRSRNPMTLIPYSIIDGKHFFKKTDVAALKKTIRKTPRFNTSGIRTGRTQTARPNQTAMPRTLGGSY